MAQRQKMQQMTTSGSLPLLGALHFGVVVSLLLQGRTQTSLV